MEGCLDNYRFIRSVFLSWKVAWQKDIHGRTSSEERKILSNKDFMEQETIEFVDHLLLDCARARSVCALCTMLLQNIFLLF